MINEDKKLNKKIMDITEERDTLKKEKDTLEKSIVDIKKERDTLKKEKDSLIMEKDNYKRSYEQIINDKSKDKYIINNFCPTWRRSNDYQFC